MSVSVPPSESNSDDLSDFETDLERAEYLQDILIDHATYKRSSNNDHYKALRRHFLDNPNTKPLVPKFVRTKRTLSHFWSFISEEFSRYKKRREFIWDEFSTLLDFLEKGGESPHSATVGESLDVLSSEYVNLIWRKATRRVQDDPGGAITLSRTLLEAVLKHVSDELGIDYGDSPSLNQLYKPVSDALNLSPEQHDEEIFKKILGSLAGVANGLGRLRNNLSDAHGKGKRSYSPDRRHAELAVNVAGSMCMFIVRTHQANKI